MENEQRARIFSRNSRNKLALIGTVLLLLIIIIIPFKFNDSQLATSKNDARLTSQLETERTQIINVFNQRFAFLSQNYNINETVILRDGNYAAILLTLDSTTYRALLIKNEGIWTVKGLPSAVLFYADFADIPQDIIKAINNLEAHNEND